MMKRGRHRSEPPDRRRGLAQWSPLLLTVVLGGLALATPKDFAVSRLLPAAPALAASMWSVGATLGLGALTLGIVLAVQLIFDEPATEFTAAVVVAVTAAAAYAAHVRLQRERTLTQVRSVADAAQAVVLRPVPPRIGDMTIETFYLAAAEEARIGGDFYAAVDTPHGVRLLIGDVRGKGLSAVGVASAVTNSFREAAYDESDLTRLARRLDLSMGRYGESLTALDAGEGFATAVLAEFPRGGDRVALVNCGHPSPLLLRRGTARSLDPDRPSPPLNMATLMGAGYTLDTVSLRPGDRLLFYTDGVTETRDREGRFFPLPEWAAGQEEVSGRRLLTLLHERLLAFSGGGLDDDIAAVVVRCEEGPVSGATPEA